MFQITNLKDSQKNRRNVKKKIFTNSFRYDWKGFLSIIKYLFMNQYKCPLKEFHFFPSKAKLCLIFIYISFFLFFLFNFPINHPWLVVCLENKKVCWSCLRIYIRQIGDFVNFWYSFVDGHIRFISQKWKKNENHWERKAIASNFTLQNQKLKLSNWIR